MSDEHLDLDALSDLLVGEGREDDVAHVGRCAGCAGRLAELDEAQLPVAAALAALPAPPVPAGLADRLATALAGAGPLPAVEPDGPRRLSEVPPPDERAELAALAPSAEAARTVTPLRRPAPRRRPLPTWLPGAAVVVLVLSAGGLAVSALPNGGGDDAQTAAGGAADESAGDTAAAPEGFSTGVVTNDSGTDYAAAPDAVSRLLPDVLAGTARSSATLTAPAPQGSEPVEEQDTASMATAPDAAADGLARLRDPAALEGCLRALLPPDGSARPLAVDYAAYAGSPALVVVLSASDPGKVDVYVVGPDCAPGADSTLFFTRVDRP